MEYQTKKNAKNPSDAVLILWREGFFREFKDFKGVRENLNNRGNNFPSSDLGVALRQSKFLTRRGKRGMFQYIQKHESVIENIEDIEIPSFSDELRAKLERNFKIELRDLNLNFGKSGNCTAFLLRKILEKLIFITFAKNNLTAKLEDSSKPDRLIGLEAMINLASREKINGVPFITPKTGKEIKGIKFLGDVSAHNPMIDVDIQTINHQMPYIITAYKELLEKL